MEVQYCNNYSNCVCVCVHGLGSQDCVAGIQVAMCWKVQVLNPCGR